MSEQTATTNRLSWRVVDMVTAAVLGVAVGLIFLVWNQVGYAGFTALDTLTPGVGGLAAGIWFMGGPLGGLIIRKPGAALFVEMLAATVSAMLGSQWGPETLLSGFAQGIGAEIVFAIFAYKVWTLPVGILSGAAAGLGAYTLELFVGSTPNITMGPAFLIIYLICTVLSGAALAGALSWFLTRGLASTGALDRFAAGREIRARV